MTSPNPSFSRRGFQSHVSSQYKSLSVNYLEQIDLTRPLYQIGSRKDCIETFEGLVEPTIGFYLNKKAWFTESSETVYMPT